jgi:hypothetical protein
MNEPIRINVDPTNPGQFFACCGLLELADRLWPEGEVAGRFTLDQFMIHVNLPGSSLKTLTDSFVRAQVRQFDTEDKAASPLLLDDPFALRLDWWCKVERDDKVQVDLGGGDRLKTWAGQQSGPLIFQRMKEACADIAGEALLDVAKAIYDTKAGKANKKTISPFYFDARREETSLDIGFSPDEQEMSVMAYPAVEALALIGLQRFRPAPGVEGQKRFFRYMAWAEPLSPPVAAAAACGLLPVGSVGEFRFTKPSRGGEYVTMFSRATRERSHNARHQD